MNILPLVTQIVSQNGKHVKQKSEKKIKKVEKNPKI
jgi:hypothetical protein